MKVFFFLVFNIWSLWLIIQKELNMVVCPFNQKHLNMAEHMTLFIHISNP